MIFGRKSEKLTRELEQLELHLEELETTQAAEQAVQDAAEERQSTSPNSDSKPRSSRPRRKPLPEDLPREVITHMHEHDCCPGCGGQLRQFGEDVLEQLERIPATYKVIRHVRPKFACAGCDRVVEAIRHPPEKIARGVVTAHIPSQSPCAFGHKRIVLIFSRLEVGRIGIAITQDAGTSRPGASRVCSCQGTTKVQKSGVFRQEPSGHQNSIINS